MSLHHTSNIPRTVTGLCSIIMLFALLAMVSSSVNAKSFAWHVKSGSSTVYLLGSIHMGVPSMYPIPREITDAFGASEFLVVEVNEAAGNPMEVQQKMLSMGTYPGADTLASHVDKATLEKLNKFVTTSGMPAQFFMKMKPGMIAITLSVMRLQQLGYSPDLGVDRHFLKLASSQNKKILELETIDQQLDLLLGFSDDALLLKHTMTQLDTMETLTAQMIDAWKAGDPGKLNKLVIEDPAKENPEYAPLMKKLLTDRNYTMTNKITSYLSSGKKYFVVVGAGHLVGNEGIVSLLEKKGFKVQQY